MIQVGNDNYGRWVVWQEDPEWNIVKGAMDRHAGQFPVELKMLLEFLKLLNPRVVMEIGTHIWKELKGFKIELSQYLQRNGIGLWRKD